MPTEQEDDQTSKRSKRKRLMDVASKVVDMITAAADDHMDCHYVLELIIDTLKHEQPCSHDEGSPPIVDDDMDEDQDD